MIISRKRYPLFLGDIAIVCLALALSLFLRRPCGLSLAYFLHSIKFFAPILPFWLLVFYILGLYETRRLHNVVNQIRDICAALLINITVPVFVFYLLWRHFPSAPKTLLVLTAFFAHMFAFLWRRTWATIFLDRLFRQKVAFYGRNSLISKIKRDIEIGKIASFDTVPMPDICGTGISANPFQDVRSFIGAEQDIDVLVVDAEELESNAAAGQSIVSFAVANDIPILTHLDFYEEIYVQVPPEYAARPTWLFSNVLHKKNQLYLSIKSKLDFIVAFAALVILSPLIFVIALTSKLLDGHSPFYTQKRTGYLGQEFTIWKFRTMVPDADKLGPLYKTDGRDSRVTPFGHILRRFRLDELPQLINVLKGDMSIIGPRPEWISEVKILEQKVPHYHLRHLVKPGITGWAQINFRATNDTAGSMEKLHYDLYYVKNISLALDISILLKTLKRVFLREAGFNETQSQHSILLSEAWKNLLTVNNGLLAGLCLFAFGLCLSVSITEIGLGMALAFYAVAAMRAKKLWLSDTKMPWYLYAGWGLYIAAALLSSVTALHPADAFGYLPSDVIKAAACVLLFAAMRPSFLKPVTISYLFGAAVTAIWGIAQISKVYFAHHYILRAGPSLNPVTYGEVIFMALILTTLFIFNPQPGGKKSKTISISAAILTAILGISLLASQSRAAILACGISLLIIGFLNSRARKPIFLSMACAALIVSGVATFNTRFSNEIRHKIISIPMGIVQVPSAVFSKMPAEQTLDFAAHTRLNQWNAAVRMIRDYPLLGVGPSNVKYIFNFYHPAPIQNEYNWSNVHSLYLQQAAERGLLGLAALLLLFGAIARHIIRSFTLANTHSVWAAAVFPGYLVINLTETSFQHAVVAMGLFFIIACAGLRPDTSGTGTGRIPAGNQ